MKHALKHGENPHQASHIVIDSKNDDPLAIDKFTTESGEPLAGRLETIGWITLTDLSQGIDAISKVAAAFETNTGRVPKIAILIQHGNPCGAAFGDNDDVLRHAIESNYRGSYAAFLITNIALTKEVELCLRQWMPAHRPFAGIAAPSMDKLGAGFFSRKIGACHMAVNPALATVGLAALARAPQSRSIRGATIAQTPNTFVPHFPAEWGSKLIDDMCLAWGICAASGSNCISIANKRKLIANAVGQPCRTSACELALLQARQSNREADLNGAAVVSDSYFAFPDGIDMLARRKVAAIFATSGSVNDAAVAEHAKQFDIVMHTVPDSVGRIFAGH